MNLRLTQATWTRVCWSAIAVGLFLMVVSRWGGGASVPTAAGEQRVRLDLTGAPGDWERVAVSLPELPWRIEKLQRDLREGSRIRLQADIIAPRAPTFALVSYRSGGVWSAPQRLALPAATLPGPAARR